MRWDLQLLSVPPYDERQAQVKPLARHPAHFLPSWQRQLFSAEDLVSCYNTNQELQETNGLDLGLSMMGQWGSKNAGRENAKNEGLGEMHFYKRIDLSSESNEWKAVQKICRIS